MSFASRKRTVDVHLGSLDETSEWILHDNSVLKVQISYIYQCANNLNNTISDLSFLFKKPYMLCSEIADVKYSGHVSSFTHYIFFSSVFWDKVSRCLAWPQTHCTDWGWLWTSDPLTSTSRVLVLQAWHYAKFYTVLGMEPRASCVVGKHSTTWASAPALVAVVL